MVCPDTFWTNLVVQQGMISQCLTQLCMALLCISAIKNSYFHIYTLFHPMDFHFWTRLPTQWCWDEMCIHSSTHLLVKFMSLVTRFQTQLLHFPHCHILLKKKTVTCYGVTHTYIIQNIQYNQQLIIQVHSVHPAITYEATYNFYPLIQNCVTIHKKLKFTNSYFKQIHICKNIRHKWYSSYVSVIPKSNTVLYTTSFLTKSKPSKDWKGLNASCFKCITMLCIPLKK